MSEELTKCNNCDCECTQSELDKNYDGFCDVCQRWYDCRHSKENLCIYYDDPCYYLCMECKNGKNFELDLTGTEEYKLKHIKELREQIKGIEKKLMEIKKK